MQMSNGQGSRAGRQSCSLDGVKDQAASLVGSWLSSLLYKEAYFFAFKSDDSTSDNDGCCQKNVSEP